MIFRDINKKPSQWFISHKVKVDDSDIHGLGVISTGKFKKDEIIEASPVIVFHRDVMDEMLEEKNDTYGDEVSVQSKRFLLFDYVFTFDKIENTLCLALGYASIYNHDTDSNAYWRMVKDKKEIQIRARREIKEGEEITLRYVHPSREGDLWF